MFCAGHLDGSGPDTCQGDSGGPAVADIDGRKTLLGVTRWVEWVEQNQSLNSVQVFPYIWKPSKGPSIYDVRKILGFFDPLPPLSAFGTDLQY